VLAGGAAAWEDAWASAILRVAAIGDLCAGAAAVFDVLYYQPCGYSSTCMALGRKEKGFLARRMKVL
jgi:hypothetical protein